MKALKVLTLCASVCCFASCGNDEATEVARPELKVAATIVSPSSDSSVDEVEGKFVAGDTNTLFFQTTDNRLLTSMDYTYGSRYFWNDVKLPQPTRSCLISACFPAVKTDSPSKVEWNVIDEAARPDLLAAAPVEADLTSSTPIRLKFSHLMHKLRVVMVAADAQLTEAELEQTEITCRNFKPVAFVDLLQGKTTAVDGQPTEKSLTAKTAEFILPGQDVEGLELKVKLEGRTRVFRLSDVYVNGNPLKRLEPGQSFTLTIQATKNDFIINGQDISGWEGQGDFNENIII